MGAFVADAIIKNLVLANKVVKNSTVVILGITFKENCPDIRNSKVIDIVERLKEYGIQPIIVDPCADAGEVYHEYGVHLVELSMVQNADCLVFAVAHDFFKKMDTPQIKSLFNDIPDEEKIIVDVKNVLEKNMVENLGYRLWRL